jgi:hypothetical protein
MPGIYGNDSQLMIDVSRLPRIEEYQQIYAADPMRQMLQIPSDIKTVSYFVLGTTDSATAAMVDPLIAIGGGGETTQGLIRREIDRAVTQWGLTNGALNTMQGGELLAPEVGGLQFQYFDGVQWLPQWDTQAYGALPVAIEVILMINSAITDAQEDPTLSVDVTDANVRYYRLVVHLPVGKPATLEDTTSGGIGAL